MEVKADPSPKHRVRVSPSREGVVYYRMSMLSLVMFHGQNAAISA
jgi:hypothetical protein